MTAADSGKISAFNLAIVLSLGFGSLTYGYGFSVVSATLGQPGFYADFNLSADATSPRYDYSNSIIGAINGTFCGGGFLGALFHGWSCDAIGRKKTLYIATPIAILGGALQAGATNIGMFLVGRLLGGFAVGILVVLVPLFQAEISPPATRGFLVSQHAVFLAMGYCSSGWVGYACYFSKNLSFQWRFPLALQSLWPLAMLLLTPFIPESPRWLLMKDRTDEAWHITATLHGSVHDQDDPHTSMFAKAEFFQMSQQVAADTLISSGESVWTLFTKLSYRKRMICGFIAMFGSESTGILVVYNYSVLLYKGLGFTGSIPLLLAAAYPTVGFIGNFINSLLVDRFGRIKLFLVGFAGSWACLIFEAALSAQYIGTRNNKGLSAGVFFLFLYIFFYASFVDASTYVYCSEIFPSHIRARGLSWSLAILFLTTIIYLEVAPTAFAQVGWKYYLLFILLTPVNFALVWFYFPETKGFTLEEIGEKFGDEIVVHLTNLSEGGRLELDDVIRDKVLGQVDDTK